MAVVIAVEAKDGIAHVSQEFGGGRAARLELHLPAVIGVQAARAPSRYASITRIRQAQQAGGIEEVEATVPAGAGAGFTVRRLFAPEKTGHAEMLTGSAEDVADRILDLIRQKGLLK